MPKVVLLSTAILLHLVKYDVKAIPKKKKPRVYC